MIIKILVFLLLIFSAINPALAQITVAIADFKNSSQSFFLDSWEKSIPEYLKGELSRSEKIVVVERRQLETVLKEQALTMTGLIDSSTAQKVGDLLGAEFVISGTISQAGKWTRIDINLIRVSTGEVKSEKVQAPDADHLTEMVTLLGNNIIFILSGNGDYQESITLKKYPTTYFLVASAGLALSTVLVNNAYNEQLDEYRSASGLSDFDDKYDTANTLYKTRNILAVLTGVALAGTIYCWINNMSPDEILAYRPGEQFHYYPGFAVDDNGNIYASINLSF
jgi:TolB-like protein